MHLQQAVDPHDLFVRCIGFGPQTRHRALRPRRPRCTTATRWTTADCPTTQRRTLIDTTLTINSFFGWDFNSCEALRQGGDVVPDRLRQRLPRHPGDLAALPLPVAGQGQPALVDLLRRDQAADARSTSTGSRTSRSPTRTSLRARSWRPTPRSPASASRPTSSSRSAPPTSPISTGRVGLLRRRRGPRRGPPEGGGAVPGPRDRRVHRALLAAHPGVARATIRRRAGSREQAMKQAGHRLVLRARRAGRDAGALGPLRPPGARLPHAPAATPRRSSASISSDACSAS